MEAGTTRAHSSRNVESLIVVCMHPHLFMLDFGQLYHCDLTLWSFVCILYNLRWFDMEWSRADWHSIVRTWGMSIRFRYNASIRRIWWGNNVKCNVSSFTPQTSVDSCRLWTPSVDSSAQIRTFYDQSLGGRFTARHRLWRGLLWKRPWGFVDVERSPFS